MWDVRGFPRQWARETSRWYGSARETGPRSAQDTPRRTAPSPRLTLFKPYRGMGFRERLRLAREAVAIITCACLSSMVALASVSVASGQDHIKETYYCNTLARAALKQLNANMSTRRILYQTARATNSQATDLIASILGEVDEATGNRYPHWI